MLCLCSTPLFYVIKNFIVVCLRKNGIMDVSRCAIVFDNLKNNKSAYEKDIFVHDDVVVFRAGIFCACE